MPSLEDIGVFSFNNIKAPTFVQIQQFPIATMHNYQLNMQIILLI